MKSASCFRGLFQFLFLVLALSISSSHAGNEAGNGGDVVVCKLQTEHGEIQTIDALDFVEARILRGQMIDFGESTYPSLEEALAKLVEALKTGSPDRARSFEAFKKTFYEKAVFLSDADLVDIPDSKHLALPKGCEVRQLIIQTKNLFDQDHQFIVDRELWKTLPSQLQAAMILHEFFYEEAIERGAENSIGVRYLTSLVSQSAGRMDEPVRPLSLRRFLTGIKQAPLQDLVEFRNLPMKASSIRLDASGRVAWGEFYSDPCPSCEVDFRLWPDTASGEQLPAYQRPDWIGILPGLQKQGFSLKIRPTSLLKNLSDLPLGKFIFQSDIQKMISMSWVEIVSGQVERRRLDFWPNSQVRFASTLQLAFLSKEPLLFYFDEVFVISECKEISFDMDGRYLSGCKKVTDRGGLSFFIQGKKVKLKPESPLTLTPRYELERFVLAEPIQILWFGAAIELKPDVEQYLPESGESAEVVINRALTVKERDGSTHYWPRGSVLRLTRGSANGISIVP